MKILRKAWKYIDGKKTAIGLVGHVLWFASNIAFKNLSSEKEALTGHAIIASITGVGIGHKVVKKVNTAIEKAKSNSN